MSKVGTKYSKSLSVLFRSYRSTAGTKHRTRVKNTFDEVAKHDGTLDLNSFLTLCRHFQLVLKQIQIKQINYTNKINNMQIMIG